MASTDLTSPELLRQEPLNADNVAAMTKLQLPLDSAKRLDRYLHEQQQYHGFYAAQGASYMTSIEECGSVPNLSPPRPSGNQPSAFASPILEPRQPPRKAEDLRANEVKLSNSATNASSAKGPMATPAVTISHGSKVEARPDTLEPVKGKGDITRKNSEARGKAKAVIEHDHLNELEHRQRLEDRKQRRRLKRELLKAPSPSPTNRSSSPETSNERKTKAAPRESRSAKATSNAKKKAGVLPGAGLMQNFSAKNVGKERLTLKPSAGIGLFGHVKSSSAPEKDSSMPKSKLRKEQKSILDIATEFDFMKPKGKKRAAEASPAKSAKTSKRVKKKRHIAQSSSESSSSGHTDHEGNHSPEENTEEDCKPPCRSSAQPQSNRQLRDCQVVKPPRLTTSPAPETLASAVQLAETKVPRYLSPPWEIDGDLIGDLVHDDSSQKDAVDAVSVGLSGDRVLDLNLKWRKSEARHTVTEKAPSDRMVDLPDSPGRSPAPGALTTSRFFASSTRQPTELQKAEDAIQVEQTKATLTALDATEPANEALVGYQDLPAVTPVPNNETHHAFPGVLNWIDHIDITVPGAPSEDHGTLQHIDDAKSVGHSSMEVELDVNAGADDPIESPQHASISGVLRSPDIGLHWLARPAAPQLFAQTVSDVDEAEGCEQFQYTAEDDYRVLDDDVLDQWADDQTLSHLPNVYVEEFEHYGREVIQQDYEQDVYDPDNVVVDEYDEIVYDYNVHYDDTRPGYCEGTDGFHFRDYGNTVEQCDIQDEPQHLHESRVDEYDLVEDQCDTSTEYNAFNEGRALLLGIQPVGNIELDAESVIDSVARELWKRH